MAKSGDDQAQSPLTRESAVAGLSGGTGVAGMVSLLPEGLVRSILLVLTPAITLGITGSWNFISDEINVRYADWRIKNERKRVEVLLAGLQNNPTASAEIVNQTQVHLDELVLLEVKISEKRVQAIVAS